MKNCGAEGTTMLAGSRGMLPPVNFENWTLLNGISSNSGEFFGKQYTDKN